MSAKQSNKPQRTLGWVVSRPISTLMELRLHELDVEYFHQVKQLRHILSRVKRNRVAPRARKTRSAL